MEEGQPADVRLHSWKEIAAYLRRDVTTVRRWEKREGLPVHRHLHERRDSVYASTTEIDRWWAGRRNQLAQNGFANGVDASGAGATGNRRVFPLVPWALAGTFLLSTLTLLTIVVVREPATLVNAGEVKFSIWPPRDSSFTSMSLSADGRQVAFTTRMAADDNADSQLWIRSLDNVDARRLPDTDGAAFPFWSPDGNEVGFFAAGKLWTIALAGGSPRALAEAPVPRGGTWGRDRVIVFAPRRDGPLFRVSAVGGGVREITALDTTTERGHLWPAFLPDGTQFVYLADSDDPDHHNLFVTGLDATERTVLIPRASSNAAYADGHLFYGRNRQLMAQPFNPRTRAFTGDAFPVAETVQQPHALDHKTDFSVAPAAVIYRSKQSPASWLDWRDRNGQRRTFISTPAEYYEPAFSPNERQVALAVFDPKPSERFGYGVNGVRGDIWLLDRETGAPSQFTSSPAADWGPLWSPNGRSIIFSSNRRGPLELYLKSVSGEHPEERLPSKGANPVAQSWSPDGEFVLYTAFDQKTSMDLWLLPLAGNREALPLLQSEFSEQQGQISPDGRWFAYSSNESGREEVYVRSFPHALVPTRVSADGGGDPRWRRDGKELFYIAPDRQLMAVAVRAGTTFQPDRAVALFDTGVPPHWYEARNLYDVSRTGRFLFMTPVEDDRSSPFTIVLNPVSTFKTPLFAAAPGTRRQGDTETRRGLPR